MHGAVDAVLLSRPKISSLSSGLPERNWVTSDWWGAASSARNRIDNFVVPTTCSVMDQRAVYLGRAHPTQRGNDMPMGSSQRCALARAGSTSGPCPASRAAGPGKASFNTEYSIAPTRRSRGMAYGV
jgi:hypothetical protein